MPRRLVDSAVWRELAPILREPAGIDAALLFFAFWTGPHSTLIGLGRLPLAYLCADLGWEMERTKEALRLLEGAGLILYEPSAMVFFLPLVLRSQPLQNPKQVDGALRVVESVPDTPLLAALHDELAPQRSDRAYLEPLLRALRQRLRVDGEIPAPALAPPPAPAPGASSEPPSEQPPDGSPVTVEQAKANVHRLAEMAGELASQKAMPS